MDVTDSIGEFPKNLCTKNQRLVERQRKDINTATEKYLEPIGDSTRTIYSGLSRTGLSPSCICKPISFVSVCLCRLFKFIGSCNTCFLIKRRRLLVFV